MGRYLQICFVTDASNYMDKPPTVQNASSVFVKFVFLARNQTVAIRTKGESRPGSKTYVLITYLFIRIRAITVADPEQK